MNYMNYLLLQIDFRWRGRRGRTMGVFISAVQFRDGDGAVVRISLGGVVVEAPNAAPFRRPPGVGALPRPAGAGELSDLREFVNVCDDDWPLVAAWRVAALRPEGPFPVLVLHGEQGSGKSTQARGRSITTSCRPV